jgi:hypothetical protein
MTVAAVSAQSFGIIGGFITTAVLGAAALIRSSRGDTALKKATNATALWTQTTVLIDQLQEENQRHQQSINDCERQSAEAKAAHGLVLAEMAALKLDHLKLVLRLEKFEPQL